MKDKNLNSKISSKGQITIPTEVRKHLGIGTGDFLKFILGDNKVVIQKTTPLDLQYYQSLDSTLAEWNSPEDDEAYNDL